MSKDMLARLTAAVLILSLIIPVLTPLQIARADDPTDWYKIVEGRLASDNYSLYPYQEHSMDMGFSKYGELIAYNAATGIGVGMQYHGFEDIGTHDQTVGGEDNDDVFANEGVPVTDWMNGWLIDIKYDRAAGQPREIWAFAMFSDSFDIGKNWITMPEVSGTNVARPLWQEHAPYANPDATKYSPNLGAAYRGGRKTNGNATTYPIEVLYDGPRLFVALLRTRISDGATPLVEVHFTIIFDRVEKHYIVLKDVKMLYVKSPLNIQFGNRGEWDLLPNSYVHFYTDEPVQYWDVDGDGDINATEKAWTFEHFRQFMVQEKYPKKWWQDVDPSQRPSLLEGVTIDWQNWLETQWTSYTSRWHVDPNIKEHGYAVAQVIHTDFEHVGALAVWPHPEFWSVQNRIVREGKDIPIMLAPLSRMLDWNRWTDTEDTYDDLEDMPNIWIKVDDMEYPKAEPDIPFIIYEHDFQLKYGVTDHYRIVSVYLMSDLHDADDADIGPTHSNVIDREIQYQLDEIFDSWDLNDAMNKDTKRWVEYYEAPYLPNYYGKNTCVELPGEQEVENGLIEPSLPVYVDWGKYWDNYCSFSERVELDLEGDGFEYVLTPIDVLDVDFVTKVVTDPLTMWKSKPYFYEIDRKTGEICIYKVVSGKIDSTWALPATALVKVLWSSKVTHTEGETWYRPEVITDQVDSSWEYFPLHHSVFKWSAPEVYIVTTPPERILDYEFYESSKDSHKDTLNTTTTGTVPVNRVYYLNETRWIEEGTVKLYRNGTELAESYYDVTYCINEDPTPPPWDGYASIQIKTAIPLTNQNLTAIYDYWTPAYITLGCDIEPSQEISIKFHIPWSCEEGWMEWKWHQDVYVVDAKIGSGTDLENDHEYYLPLPSDFVEKVWHHSEKSILCGDYVLPDDSLILSRSLPWSEYLLASYNVNKAPHEYLLHAASNTETGDTYAESVYAELKPHILADDYFNTVFTLPNTPDYEPSPEIYRMIGYEAVVLIGPGPKADYSSIPALRSAFTSDPTTYLVNVRGPYGSRTIGAYTYQIWNIDWLVKDGYLTRGNYLIHETTTCDELVLDQPLNPGEELKILYEVPGGRYEWTVVGKNAATVDSIGAALVTAAIKDKDMEIGIGGLDIRETPTNDIPWVFHKFGAGSDVTDYHYNNAAGDHRTALMDDWCTTWPIASSNMIGVGGPIANMLAYYGNDFMQAIYGIPAFAKNGTAPSRWSEKVVGITCWSAIFGRTNVDPDEPPHIYASSEDLGYAVVATTKDKNGTVILTIWGHWGRDTYYATRWFDYNKFALQHINKHVTSIILEIDYTDPKHPDVYPVEFLGTISEKPPHQDNPS